MPRVFFINRFFYPDHSATSQILSDLAFHLAAGRVDTVVITSQQLYSDATIVLAPEELIRQVFVIRVRTTRFGRANLIGRAFDYFSFYFMAGVALLQHCKRNDVIVAKTDPPMISVVCMLAARAKRAHLVNWLQDLFPEVAIQLKVGVSEGRAARFLLWLRNCSLLRARCNVAIGEKMQVVINRVVPKARVAVIPNWADDEAIKPIPRMDNQLRHEWGFGSKYVVGYSGNLGRAHDVSTLVNAAELLRDEPDIVFLIIGGGALLGNLKAEVRMRGLNNVEFKTYQPREMLAQSLGVPDLHVVMLQAELEGLIVPSKFYGVAAAGRPTAFIGSRIGEIANILAANDCGTAFDVGDAAGLARYALELSRNMAESMRVGCNARAALDASFSKRRALDSWTTLVSDIIRDVN